MTDLSARTTKAFEMGNALFGDLGDGDYFKFKWSEEIMRKTSPRRYRRGPRTYTTGARTAVFKLGRDELRGLCII